MFYTVKVVDTLTGFPLRKLNTSARYTVIQIRLRNLDITSDFVMVSQIFINICGNNLCGRDRADYGSRTGSAVSAGKNSRKIAESAEFFSHDFSSFCTLDKREKGDLTRTVTEAKVGRCGDLVTFTVAADGFLYNMVRIMVGTLLRVQQGKFAPEDIPGIIQAKDRKAAGPTAPAWGLYLNKVFY